MLGGFAGGVGLGAWQHVEARMATRAAELESATRRPRLAQLDPIARQLRAFQAMRERVRHKVELIERLRGPVYRDPTLPRGGAPEPPWGEHTTWESLAAELESAPLRVAAIRTLARGIAIEGTAPSLAAVNRLGEALEARRVFESFDVPQFGKGGFTLLGSRPARGGR